MLRSVVVRLTLSYLAIIMGLSIGFSFSLYHISAQELEHDLRRPAIEQLTPGGFLNYDQFRDNRLNENQQHLQHNLILLNFLALFLGSMASYTLAKRTLRPIKQTMEAQSRFTADASHELRTPLTAMETEIEVALRDKKLSKSDTTALLQSNLEEVIKLKALSDSLLKLAHQDTTDELEFEPVNLAQTAQTAIDQLSAVATSKRIEIKPELNKIMVNGEPKMLSELVIVLVDNAIKYSSDDKTITIKTASRGQVGQIIIEDNGVGIKAAELPHIFDRFYRIDQSRTKNTPGGHGLGLSIAKKIVELHNGTIQVKSKYGQGSIFTVSIPIAKT